MRMMVKTYLKNHPEIKEVWLQAKDKTGGPNSFCKCNVIYLGHIFSQTPF